jgi:hypothetical protein
MKKIHYLIPLFLVSVFVSAQTIVFNVQEVKAKDYLESKLEEAYETCCKDIKPNKGGFALQKLGKGADDGMTHRFLWYWEIGEDLWEGTDIWDKAPLWFSQTENYVEEYGEQYMGRVLSEQKGTNEDYKWDHIWDIKASDPNQFKIAHDKILKKFKKQFEGRWAAFGTYDINHPNGATHWVGVSGKDDHEHVMLLDELQKQSEFIKLLGERGKVENVRDYMVLSLKTY